MTKVYQEGTTLQEIIKDGWARGFQVSQTLSEATDMGYTLTEESILAEWELLDKEVDNWIAFEKEAGWIDWDM